MLRRKKSKADHVRDYAHDLADKAGDLAEKAAESLAPRVHDAREVAETAYEQASTKVRSDYAPAAKAAAGSAYGQAAAKLRDEYDHAATKLRDEYAPAARSAAVSATAKVPGIDKVPGVDIQEPTKKRSKLARLLVVTGIGALAFVVVKRVTADKGGSYAGPPTSSASTSSAPSRPAATPPVTTPADVSPTDTSPDVPTPAYDPADGAETEKIDPVEKTD